MSRAFGTLCLRFFCALIASKADELPDVQISVTTLQSDLDLLLDDTTNPRDVNIEYTENAILHLSVLPKTRGLQRMYIKFHGLLNIKLTTGHILQRSDLVYVDGTFNCQKIDYLIIKQNSHLKFRRVHETLSYTSTRQLIEYLTQRTIENSRSAHYKQTTVIMDVPLGSSTLTLIFDPDLEQFLFKAPLKGLSLYDEDSQSGCCEILNVVSQTEESSSSSAGPPDSSSCQTTGEFDVFFDVWYEPKCKRFGSSSGSLRCIDAVRVYDEWYQDFKKDKEARTSEEMRMVEYRGEYIRSRVFLEDMNIAFKRLHSESELYKNVIINYANEIVLDVQGGQDGHHPYISGTGTTETAPMARKPANVKAYYNQEKLEYSDQVATNDEFKPKNHGKQTSYLQYIDWGTFETHFRGVWKAMQGGCIGDPRRNTYTFSIFYGDSIQVKYDCQTKTLVMVDVILMLTEVPNFQKGVITTCKSIRYQHSLEVDIPSLPAGTRPIAIQLEPERIGAKYSTPVSINIAVLNDEMKFLANILVIYERMYSKPTLGTILMNDQMPFELKRPERISNPRYVKVYGEFTQRSSSGNILRRQLDFHRSGAFMTAEGDDIPANELFTPRKYKAFTGEKLAIGSKYLTTGQLRLYLGNVMEAAMRRCSSRTIKTLWFKLIQNRKFELSGYCDCSEGVILIEGKFRALLQTYTDGRTEVRTARFINDFVYVHKDRFLILGSGSFEDVYAISIPKISTGVISKSYGAPIKINDHNYILFKT